MRTFFIVIIFALQVLFVSNGAAFALTQEDLMPEVAYAWMYYAEGWGMGPKWGDTVDLYVRFCHPETSEIYMSQIRQAAAYLKNISRINFHIVWNQVVPSGKANLYVGNPKDPVCCYDGPTYGYTAVQRACSAKKDTFSFENASFVSELVARPIFFYRELANTGTAFSTHWHSRYWKGAGDSILGGHYGFLGIPSPIDDQILHVSAVWNEELSKSWNTDYRAMAILASQMRIEDRPVSLLPSAFPEVFAKFWNSNDKWCTATLHVNGNRVTIRAHLNFIPISDSLDEHWYSMVLRCYWSDVSGTLLCPLGDVALQQEGRQFCTGAFVHLVTDDARARLSIYRVSVDSWGNELENGRYLYLRFYIDYASGLLILEKVGFINRFEP